MLLVVELECCLYSIVGLGEDPSNTLKICFGQKN